MARRSYPKVLARVEGGPVINPVGREGETLLMLVEKGAKGLRAYDFRGGPPFRLAAYVCDLRTMGVGIATSREKHATGDHAVYTLTSAVLCS